MNRLTIVWVFFALLMGGLAAPAIASDSPGAPVYPDLPYTGGFLGADAGYSVALASGRSLWLFGDTFVADPGETLRSKSKTMVRNSVGITQCDGKNPCSVQYYWNNPRDPKPRSFFDTGKDDLWYWPMDAVLEDGVLYVALSRVRNLPDAKPGDAFGFEVAGTSMATIANPMDLPNQWKITYQYLTNSNVWPGVSMVVDGGYVYFVTSVNQGKQPSFITLLRVPRGQIAYPNGHSEYWGKDKKWHEGFSKTEAMPVMEPAASEMTLRYHPDLGKWVAVMSGPEFPSSRIVARTAPAITGPWSGPKTIYEIPEMKRGQPGYDKDTFCYAGKEHIEFASGSKLMVTYACNSFVFKKTVENMAIYYLKTAVVELKK